MPAIPLLISAGVSAYGAYQSHKDSSNAQKLQQQQMAMAQPAMDQQLALGKQQGQQSQALFSSGMPLVSRAANYYQNLLTGSRGAIQGAIAPEVNALTDTYRGAARSIARTAPGPTRDMAQSELARQRAGQIGGIALNARPAAAAATGALGSSLLGQSTGAAGNAGSILSALLQGQVGLGNLQLSQNRFNAEQQGAFGQAIGTTLTSLIQAYNKYKTGKTPPSFSPFTGDSTSYYGTPDTAF